MSIARYSKRSSWNTEKSELALTLETRAAKGLPLADLTASNPTHCGFEYSPTLLDPLLNAKALTYDPDPLGILSARQAVSQYYHEHHAELAPENIVLTTSTSEAYSYLFRLLCDPGSEILVVEPSYPLFDYLADLEDVTLVPVPLFYDHGWQIDPDGLRLAISEKTRALVIVHPNNPTGHFSKPWEQAEIAKICHDHNLALIVDEVFLDYPAANTDPSAIQSFLSLPWPTALFVVSGLSKICALPQMKAAWIAAAGTGVQESMARLEVIADTFLSMNAPIQLAMPEWLKNRHAIQDQIRERVLVNLASLDQQLATQSLIQRLAYEGGWYAVLRIPALQPDEQLAIQLLKKGLSVHPGYFFSLPPSGWLVLSLLAPQDEFEDGIKTLIEHFKPV